MINLLQGSDFEEWTPTSKTRLGNISLSTTATQAFHLPALIPASANNTLLFVDIQAGRSSPDRSSHVKLYATHNGVQYTKYISVHTYDQEAWSTNSDNIWLPVLPNRVIYAQSPSEHSGHIISTIDIIGYS